MLLKTTLANFVVRAGRSSLTAAICAVMLATAQCALAGSSSYTKYAPVLTLNNYSCKDIRVTIDGEEQPPGFIAAAGKTRLYPLGYYCPHLVIGQAGEEKWSSSLACGSQNYTINWTFMGEMSKGELSGGELILKSSVNVGSGGGNIQITSKSDCITIVEVETNRGNCKISGDLPRVLKFGEILKLQLTIVIN